jgi:hypothetical protein
MPDFSGVPGSLVKLLLLLQKREREREREREGLDSTRRSGVL